MLTDTATMHEVQEAERLFGKLIPEINRKLNAGLAYEEILDFVFDAVGVLIPYDRMGIAVLDESGENIALKWVRSKVPVKNIRKNYSAPLHGSSLQKLLETGQPRIISDLANYAARHPESKSSKLIVRDGIRSSLTCPLRSGNRPIGVVFFSSKTPGTYDNNHIDTFLQIADELSVIVEQGRLKNFFEASSSKTKALKMMIHDLRSPLSVIQGFLEAISDEAWYRDLGPEGKEVFSILQRNTGYMLELLNELAELTRLEREGASADPHRFQDVDLDRFCREMMNYGRILAEQKEIELNQTKEPGLPDTARFDPQKIRRVLDNLIANAIKFSRRHTRIECSMSQEPGRLVFSVKDHGLGIPESEIPKLFTEFGKTSVQPTEGESSTGLGLVIAKKIVEQHGGRISVRSKVGEGSAFTFWIPLGDSTSLH